VKPNLIRSQTTNVGAPGAPLLGTWESLRVAASLSKTLRLALHPQSAQDIGQYPGLQSQA